MNPDPLQYTVQSVFIDNGYLNVILIDTDHNIFNNAIIISSQYGQVTVICKSRRMIGQIAADI